jgi:hypothetical protein
MHRYTPKEIRFLESNVSGRSYAEVTALFNKRFGLSMSASQIGNTLKNYGLTNGRDCRFYPGQVPFNKGRKGVPSGKETQFKAGSLPWNYQPVGTERINVNGYAEVKIADPNVWKSKQILIWEAANGKVPDGNVIIFADGNKLNFAPDNLLMVSRAELAVMNHLGLIYDDADSTKSGKTIADIKIRMSERKKRMKKKAD